MATIIGFRRGISCTRNISLPLDFTSRLSSFRSHDGYRKKYFTNISRFRKSEIISSKPITSCIPVLSRSYCTENSKVSMFEDLKSSPSPAILLGLSGAIPFCGLACLSFITPEYLDTIIHAQCTYGACILTFLGAVHWGYAIAKDSCPLKPNWGTLGYSVTPSLVAWSALLIKPQYGLVTIAIGLLYALSKDLGTPCFPRWYHALRKVLTTLASTSVILTAMAYYLH